MLNQIELEVVQALLGLLVVVVGTAIVRGIPLLEAYLDKKIGTQQAEMANKVIDGLSTIVSAVVQQFNQTVVEDAKKEGKFDAALAAKVKADAINAVKAQGANLVALGKNCLGDVEKLIDNLIEQEVANNHLFNNTVNIQPATTITNGATSGTTLLTNNNTQATATQQK
ncbi:hypothetical protein Tsac_2837 [Thermoanaerobacterium phage THSA-485A]|uniref:hypothetical protein n=1 Tax=Thermoanaerobacterium phage THSA-485A TaxID=1126885 RepID=UPI000263F82E|nr:hypothetical protein Tsac_2837 [Thermoanaerobacterium phage THSA-485A]AFK87690.1 hypothetical protein Tsac_2837 [Thermoanaerobacterium phage THSA-485A]